MKLLHWVSKWIIGTLLITALSVGTTWYVITLYVEELLRQFHLPVAANRISFSDFAAKLSEDLSSFKLRDSGSVSPKAEPVSAAVESSGKQEPSAAESPKPDASTPHDPPHPKGDAVAVWGQMAGESQQSDASAQKQSIVFSTEEFARKKEQLTSEDKARIFSLLASKMPQTELQRLSKLLEDGITNEELKEVEDILHKHLEQDEYQQLVDILRKY